MYRLLISDETRLDILDAFSWYESRRPGLGKDFELCLEVGLNQIQRDTSLYHYLVDSDRIKVFGVFHTSRNPINWKISINPPK